MPRKRIHVPQAESRGGIPAATPRFRPAPAGCAGRGRAGQAASRCCGCRRRRRPRRLLQQSLTVFFEPDSRPLRSACQGRPACAAPGADIAVQLVVGVFFPDCARVEHHHVGVGALGRAVVTGGLEQAGQPLGIVDVHLAAVGPDLVGATVSRTGQFARRIVVGQHRCHMLIVRSGPRDREIAD